MDNKKITTALIVAVPLLFGGLLVHGATQPDAVTEPAATQQVVETPEVDAPDVVVSEDGKTVTYSGVDGQTALALLRDGVEVGTEESSFGEFVRSINGKIADEDSEYWAFYVDGEYAAEGAGTYETSDVEEIKWVLEAL